MQSAETKTKKTESDPEVIFSGNMNQVDKLLLDLANDFTNEQLLNLLVDYFSPQTIYSVGELYRRKVNLANFLFVRSNEKDRKIQDEISGVNNPEKPEKFKPQVQCINCYNYFNSIEELNFHQDMTNIHDCDYHGKQGNSCLEILLRKKEVLNNISLDQACERCDEICPSCLNAFWG